MVAVYGCTQLDRIPRSIWKESGSTFKLREGEKRSNVIEE